MIEPQPEEIKNARGLIHIATVKRTGPFSSGRAGGNFLLQNVASGNSTLATPRSAKFAGCIDFQPAAGNPISALFGLALPAVNSGVQGFLVSLPCGDRSASDA